MHFAFCILHYRDLVMLMPKKVKYRKQQRGRMRGKAWRGSDVSFGEYGLKALEPCWLTDRQIEAARGGEAADPHQVRHALCPGEDAMKAAELRDLGADELDVRERELTDQLFRLRIQKSMGQLEAPNKIKGVRRDLARVKTVLRQKRNA